MLYIRNEEGDILDAIDTGPSMMGVLCDSTPESVQRKGNRAANIPQEIKIPKPVCWANVFTWVVVGAVAFAVVRWLGIAFFEWYGRARGL